MKSRSKPRRRKSSRRSNKSNKRSPRRSRQVSPVLKVEDRSPSPSWNSRLELFGKVASPFLMLASLHVLGDKIHQGIVKGTLTKRLHDIKKQIIDAHPELTKEENDPRKEFERRRKIEDLLDEGMLKALEYMHFKSLRIRQEDLDTATAQALDWALPETTKTLLSWGASNYNKILEFACSYGHLKIVEFMLSSGPNSLEYSNPYIYAHITSASILNGIKVARDTMYIIQHTAVPVDNKVLHDRYAALNQRLQSIIEILKKALALRTGVSHNFDLPLHPDILSPVGDPVLM